MTSTVLGAIPPLIAIGVVSGITKQLPKVPMKKKKKRRKKK